MTEAGKSRSTVSEFAAWRSGSGRPAERLKLIDPEAALVVGLVAAARGTPLADLLQTHRCRAGIALDRQLAMYLTHVALGRSMTDVGALFGRDRTTVAHACRLIEDRREDSRFDTEVNGLEAAIAGRLAASEPQQEVRHAS